MREFLILFKHDLKMLFPILNLKRKRFDVFGILCTLLLTALLSVIVVSLVSKIATGYVLVKVNKVLNETQRAVEFLNLLYCFMFVVMIFSCVRKIHSTLRIKKNKHSLINMWRYHQLYQYMNNGSLRRKGETEMGRKNM